MLAGTAALLWRPVENVTPDPAVASPRAVEGGMSVGSRPVDRPESLLERYATLIDLTAKPSRWFRFPEFEAEPEVQTDASGLLRGEVGLSFRFVGPEEEADGARRLRPTWGMD